MSLPETRSSARADATAPTCEGYIDIPNALEEIADDAHCTLNTITYSGGGTFFKVGKLECTLRIMKIFFIKRFTLTMDPILTVLLTSLSKIRNLKGGPRPMRPGNPYQLDMKLITYLKKWTFWKQHFILETHIPYI